MDRYKVGIVLSIDAHVCKSPKGGKALRSCQVDIGDENPITVVTAASNVREKSRIVVAPVGSSVIDEKGEEMEVKKMSVGGVMSEGIFCDSRMLGWKGGAEGVAVVVPDTFELGAAPPSEKPRPKCAGGEAESADIGSAAPGLFEKKLTKEEKKKLALERKAARKAKKEAKANADAN